jgi:hypothetical protein
MPFEKVSKCATSMDILAFFVDIFLQKLVQYHASGKWFGRKPLITLLYVVNKKNSF